MNTVEKPMIPQDCLQNKKIYWYDFTNDYQEIIPPQSNIVIFMDIRSDFSRELFQEHLLRICEYFDSCEILLKIPQSFLFLVKGSEAWHPKIYIASDWPRVSYSYYLLKIG